jgi:hypothetical protein
MQGQAWAGTVSINADPRTASTSSPDTHAALPTPGAGPRSAPPGGRVQSVVYTCMPGMCSVPPNWAACVTFTLVK